MGSRRLLRSVAYGIAHLFASRNNDADGWWVPGLLLELVSEDDPGFSVDLVSGATRPELTSGALTRLGPGFAHYLRWSAGRHGISPAVIASATLDLRFDPSRLVSSWNHGGKGRPFTCSVIIRDDRGRDYTAVAYGHCTTRDGFGSPKLIQSIVTVNPRVLGRVLAEQVGEGG